MKKLKTLKPRNFIAKDLLTPKYHMRIVESKKKYNRKIEKSLIVKELYGTGRKSKAIT